MEAKSLRPNRPRRGAVTPRSLNDAERAITDGDRSIGEISDMVKLEDAGAIYKELPDIDVQVAAIPVPTMDSACRDLFGMPVAPLMLCIVSLGSVLGMMLGLALEGSPVHQALSTFFRSVF